jgi:photosystem II stability/assembly factor-like uncharacterized protein
VLLAALGGTARAAEGTAPARDPLDLPAILTPRAKTSQLIGIARAGARLVAVGQLGHILTSDDLGKTWLQADVPLSADLVAVYFPTPEQGWVTGHYGVILHSADGGRHWTRQLDGRAAEQIIVGTYRKKLADGVADMERHLREAELDFKSGPALPFLDVFFRDERTGYAVGAFGLLMITTDGGESWVPAMERIDNPDALHLNAIRGRGDALYIASERGTVFRYEASEGRFVRSETGYTGSFFGVIAGPEFVLAFGLRGNAYRSTDGGRSWRRVETGTDSNLNGGAVLEDGRLVLGTRSGSLLVSRDQGASFEVVPGSSHGMIAGLAPADPGAVAVVGLQGVRIERLP